jgi:general secretion pathway protein A
MYEAYFGVQRKPFGMTPDPAFLYLNAKHREALAGLVYAVMERKGFLVLTGDAGTGKTTLLAQALRGLPLSRVQSSVVLNPTLTTSEFLEMVMMDFGIEDIPASKAQRLALLQGFLVQANHNGKISALIIDEAHKLSHEVLEEIRLLGNIELPNQKLIQILLVGQDELGDLLNRSDLRQLKQRIAVRFTIDPLSGAEIQKYIQHRWLKGGASTPVPFDPDALQAIAKWSGGIPRVINAICENALLLAYGENVSLITVKQVTEACLDLDLVRPSHTTPAAPISEFAKSPLGPASPVLAQSEPVAVPLLERYADTNAKPSLWTRWAGRLGFANGNGGSV